MPNQLTIKQVSLLCAVEPGTVRRWIAAGKLRAARLPGGNYRVALDELERALNVTFDPEQIAAVKAL